VRNPNEMTPAERFKEVADLLARGLLRSRGKRVSDAAPPRHDGRPVDGSPPAGGPTRRPTRTHPTALSRRGLDLSGDQSVDRGVKGEKR